MCPAARDGNPFAQRCGRVPAGKVRIRVRAFLVLALGIWGGTAQKLRSWRSADFDPGSHRPLPTSAPGFVALDGVMYHFGGNTPEGRSNRLYKYDPDNVPSWILLDAATAGVQGNPPQPRSRFDITATEGCVYVFGGWTPSGYANDLHQFNTRTFVWRQLDEFVAGAPPSPRYFFGITALDGDVYIFGGMANTGLPTNDLYKFDSRSMVWTAMNAYGDVPAPRFSHAFAAMGGSLFLFSGKTSGAAYSDEFFRFDLGTQQWKRLEGAEVQGISPAPRVDSKFAILDGSLYLFGGLNSTNDYSNELFVFNEVETAIKWTWSDLTPTTHGRPPEPRSRHGFAASKGSLYVFGAISDAGRLNDVFQFSVANSEWKQFDTVPTVTGTAPSGRYGHALAQLDNIVYMFGGNTTDGFSGAFAKWEQSKWTWTSITSQGAIPGGRFGHGFVSLPPALFVFGGETDQGLSNDLYKYEPASSVWTARGAPDSAPAPRARHGFCMLQDSLFVFGGLTANGPSNELFRYRDDADTWVRVDASNPPSARHGSGLTGLDKALYIFGGVTLTGYSSELFKCEISSDGTSGIWRSLDATSGVQGQVLQATSGHALVSSGLFVYLFGGWRDTKSLNADGSQGVYFHHLYQPRPHLPQPLMPWTR